MKFDLTTHDGVIKAQAYQTKLYQRIMQWTPRQRYDWLCERGWKRVGKAIVKPEEGNAEVLGPKKPYVRVDWALPEDRFFTKTVLNQTEAICLQIWWNMEESSMFVTLEGRRHEFAAAVSAV